MNEELASLEIKWNKGICINVVLASNGYTLEFVKVYEININGEVKNKVLLVEVNGYKAREDAHIK